MCSSDINIEKVSIGSPLQSCHRKGIFLALETLVIVNRRRQEVMPPHYK